MKKLSHAIILILLILQSSMPSVYASSDASAQLRSSVTSNKQVLGLADMSSVPEASARKPLHLKLQSLQRHDYTANENVTATISNPDQTTFSTKVIDVDGKEVPVDI